MTATRMTTPNGQINPPEVVMSQYIHTILFLLLCSDK